MLYVDCISIYLSSTTPAPLYAVCRLYQYLSVVNSSSSATCCMQTVSVSICRQQLQLRYMLYVDCIIIYLQSKAPAPLYAACKQSVSTCRQQLQLPFTLFIDCISIYQSSTGPAPLYAVCRLYQYRQQLQLPFTLFIDCISIYLPSTASAPLNAVYRLHHYLYVVNSSSSSIRCLQTISVSICRQQLQVRYTLLIDCISIYLSSTAPAPLYAVCGLYQYLSVVNSFSASTRCLQIISVSICRQQLHLRYTLYVDWIGIVNSSSSAIRCMQTVSVSTCRQKLQLRYTLYVDYQYLPVVNSSRSPLRCLQTVSVSICRQQLHLRDTLYVDFISIVNSSSSPLRCLQTVSVSIYRQQLQLRYTLFIDCISIYLSSTVQSTLYAVYRLYQYLSVVNSSSSAIRCLLNLSISIY